MSELLAIATIMFWLVIPLFWIPVHLFSVSYRRIGLKAYLIPLVMWLPCCFALYVNRELFLEHRIAIPHSLSILGGMLLVSGLLLHVWTARLLGLWGIIGVPEVSVEVQTELVTRGPFAAVRHPTYLAHTLIFSGAFLMTGVLAVGIVTILDFLIVNLLIIPLEEKDLKNRFESGFHAYKKKVPYRFVPGIF